VIRRVLALALLLFAIPTSAALAQEPMAASTDVVVLHPSGDMMMTTGGLGWVTPDRDHLIVTLLVWGLAPGSAHSNHIYAGSCQNEGAIVYPLADLVADATGNATATTIVPADMSMMGMMAHYVNVHAGILGTSAAAAPGITCGNIGAMEPMMMPMMEPMMPTMPMDPSMPDSGM